MKPEIWPDIVRFGEAVCSSLRCDTVQQRVLPEFVRMTDGDSGGVYLFDKDHCPTMVSAFGIPVDMLYQSLDGNIFRKDCPFMSRAMSMRFPVHDGLMYQGPRAHRESELGIILGDYGFEHCLYAPLVYSGRLIGSVCSARAMNRPQFTTGDLRVAERLSRLTRVAVTNAVKHEALHTTAEAADRNPPVETVRLSPDHVATNLVAPRAQVSNWAREVLSARETQVLELLVVGLTNAEIGQELGIALNTVKRHVGNIYEKLDVRTRFEAVQIGARFGR